MNGYHFLFVSFIACLAGCGLGRLSSDSRFIRELIEETLKREVKK